MHILLVGAITTSSLAEVLDVTSAPPGRGASSVSRLVVGLRRAGHRLTVVTCDPSIQTAHDAVLVEGDGVTIAYGPYRANGRARDAFRVEREWMVDQIRSRPADVVHAHWTYEEAMAALAVRPDSLVTVRDWGPSVLWHHRHPYRVVRLGMQLLVLRRARHLLAPSPRMASRASRLARVDVRVIPNPVGDGFFDAPLREGRAPDGPVVLAVNNGWGPLKNVSILLRAFARIRAEVPGATLRLVGIDHEPGGPAATWAGEHGLDAGVVFVGPISADAVAAEMAAADVFVHAALEESFGNVVAEAMASGAPVVAGRAAGAVPWVVGDTGALVDVTDPVAVAGAVMRLLTDDSARARASADGRARAHEAFRLDAVTAAHVERYEALLGGSEPG